MSGEADEAQPTKSTDERSLLRSQLTTKCDSNIGPPIVVMSGA
jgi:hypothetical protein